MFHDTMHWQKKKRKEKAKKDEKRNERRQFFTVIRWLDFPGYLKKYSYEVLEKVSDLAQCQLYVIYLLLTLGY